MADMNLWLPFLRKWEGGFVEDPVDLGGATNRGVTLRTFRAFCRRQGRAVPGVEELRRISEEDWRQIVREGYWDRCRGDEIVSQPVAEQLVDWVWCSGVQGIRRVQGLLGLDRDGVVGPRTLAALNGFPDAEGLCERIRRERMDFIEEICRKRPANLRFRKGWMNRIREL